MYQEVISRKVLVDEGLRQVVELEQSAIWRFLWLSGTISVHLLVDQNRRNYSVSNLRKYPSNGMLSCIEAFPHYSQLHYNVGACLLMKRILLDFHDY